MGSPDPIFKNGMRIIEPVIHEIESAVDRSPRALEGVEILFELPLKSGLLTSR